jgi:hypothetical protein
VPTHELNVRCWGKSGLGADALLVRPGVGRDEGVVGDYLDKARVDADPGMLTRLSSVLNHVYLGPVSRPIRTASSRSRCCGLRIG